MNKEKAVEIKEEPKCDTSIDQLDADSRSIQDMLLEIQKKDHERRSQTGGPSPSVRTCQPVDKPTTAKEHDENSFYNVHSMLRQTLVMRTGESSIILEPKLTSLYNGSNLSYDRALLNRADMWHQVIVHHDTKYSKQQILDMLFENFPLCDCFPVAYRRHVNVDFFLVRMCSQLLVKLFEDGLKLKYKGVELPLSVRLGAAVFYNGQIFPRQTIAKAVQERSDNAAQYGTSNMLNLDSFRGHAYLQELCICLANRTQLETLCSAVAQVMNANSCLNTLRLSNNGISNLNLLAALKDTKLVSLDLRGNNIQHTSHLSCLRGLPLIELFVADNGLTESTSYAEDIYTTFPKLMKLDSMITGSSSTTIPQNTEEEEEVVITSDGTLITESDMNPTAFLKYQMTPHWHQVTVIHNGVCNKQDILDALFNLVGKYSFFPCYYKTYSKRDEFLVQGCFEALLFLIKQKLRLSIPSAHAVLKIALAMNVAQASDKDVVPLRKLEQFVTKRFKLGCLDLSSMQPELNECKYVDFCARSPNTLGYMMELAAQKFAKNCLVLRLRHNGLQNCEALRSLNKFSKLVSLDLRYNSFENFSDLHGIPWNNINEVFLDNNPLCGTVRSPVEYVRKVKEYFRALQQLDGKPLLGNFIHCQNYLCTPEAYKFAESFVKHFFCLFDSFRRSELQELYHAKAQFSMTCDFELANLSTATEMNAQQQRQASYMQHSRNILHNRDRRLDTLIVGYERIGYVLTSYPKMTFDFYSFRIDVPIYSAERVMIVVHGRLRECDESPDDQSCHMGFTRTWVLQPCGMGTNLFHEALEYKIHNDMLHLYSMTHEDNERMSRGQHKEKEKEGELDTTSNPTTTMSEDVERQNSLIVFKELTQLNNQWAMRCLEESSWNLKLALTVFLKLYESKRIPKIAFNGNA
uniref:NTF2 domain-containing protein n=1 Tax=Anopheles farauti TaxID=69004 RepID=A0A182QD77_9DIPT